MMTKISLYQHYLQKGYTMKATKDYGECGCGCGRMIKKSDDFKMSSGEFYLDGHDPASTAPNAPSAAAPAVTPKRKRRATQEAPHTAPAAAASSPATPKRKLAQAAPEATQKSKAKAEPKEKAAPKAKVLTPNGLTIQLLCERKYIDEDIFKRVAAKFPDRNVKQVKMDISVNRSMLNSEKYYKTVKEKYNITEPIERLIKVGKELIPASQMDTPHVAPVVEAAKAPATGGRLRKRAEALALDAKAAPTKTAKKKSIKKATKATGKGK